MDLPFSVNKASTTETNGQTAKSFGIYISILLCAYDIRNFSELCSKIRVVRKNLLVLDMVRGPKTLESSFGHDSNPSAQKLAFFHGMGSENHCRIAKSNLPLNTSPNQSFGYCIHPTIKKNLKGI